MMLRHLDDVKDFHKDLHSDNDRNPTTNETYTYKLEETAQQALLDENNVDVRKKNQIYNISVELTRSSRVCTATKKTN